MTINLLLNQSNAASRNKNRYVIFFIFLVGLLSFVHIKLIGDLYISEVILAGITFLKIRKVVRILSIPWLRTLIYLGILWLVSQIITDILKKTSLDYALKGIFSVAFILTDIIGLFILINNSRNRLEAFTLGIALSGFLYTFLTPSDYATTEFWKFGYGVPFTLLVLIFFSRGKFNSKFSLCILFILGAVSISLNARSLGGMTILTGLIAYFSQNTLLRKKWLNKLSPFKLMRLFSGAIGLVYCILLAYQLVGDYNFLPNNVQDKYEHSKSSTLGVFGLILVGRSEFLASIPAVIDSPIIGHGSWAMNSKYKWYLSDADVQLGLVRDNNDYNISQMSDLIPAHSHLMQAWVWAGVLGAVFWVYVLWIVISKTLQAMRNNSTWVYLVVFIGISSIWDVLFSPLGANVRLTWGWRLIVLLLATNILRKHSNINKINTIRRGI